MITIEKLKSFGADADDGLTRCLNDEDFYLMLVGSALDEGEILKLEKQISEGDLASAFETAHALKGVYANLSLTPLYETVFGITEHLRAKESIDYSDAVTKLKTQMHELISLASDQ